MFDRDDKRTHPEGVARVEMEFPTGRRVVGQYSRDTGMFVFVGPEQAALDEFRPVKWRYVGLNPDQP